MSKRSWTTSFVSKSTNETNALILHCHQRFQGQQNYKSCQRNYLRNQAKNPTKKLVNNPKREGRTWRTQLIMWYHVKISKRRIDTLLIIGPTPILTSFNHIHSLWCESYITKSLSIISGGIPYLYIVFYFVKLLLLYIFTFLEFWYKRLRDIVKLICGNKSFK